MEEQKKSEDKAEVQSGTCEKKDHKLLLPDLNAQVNVPEDVDDSQNPYQKAEEIVIEEVGDSQDPSQKFKEIVLDDADVSRVSTPIQVPENKMEEIEKLQKQLKYTIFTLKDEGILDRHYDELVELNDETDPQFHLNVIMMFYEDTEKRIAEISQYMNEPVIDYVKVTHVVHKLKGSSSSVGGSRLALASRELRIASQINNFERTIEALNKVKLEYQTLKKSFDCIFQLEHAISAHEVKSAKAKR